MESILADRSKFIAVDENNYKLTQHLESRLNKTLLMLYKAGKLDKDTYNSLRAIGSSPGKLYGLPKTHKTGVPLRPILSAVTCHNYKLAKFLVPLLSPLASSEYTVSDVFSFTNEIRQSTDSDRKLMISLDIESLFTNVPVAETIDIILSKLFANASGLYHGFNRKDFQSLLQLAVDDSYFSFNNKLYKQTDGMSMGSPLGPLFANIFLSHYESKWLEESPVKPSLYKRYVDDTLWFLPADADIPLLMTFMNSRHPNMRFTYETENNNSINFIGVTITHTSSNNLHGYQTSVYRKSTCTGLFTNYNSFTPLIYRLSVFKCLVYRAYHLCSSWNLFHEEISNLRTMLLRNAYPSWVLDRIVKCSLNKFIQPNLKYGPNKERVYIGLPFLGRLTDQMRRSIKQINKQLIPHKDIIVYFKPGKRISNFFHVKDSTPFELRSHVIYKYTCARCQSSYIGQTARHLRHRIAEHAGTSHLTGKIMKSQSHSNIREHCSRCPGSDCSEHNFKILARGTSELELLIKERLLINNEQPTLNGNIGSFELLLA